MSNAADSASSSLSDRLERHQVAIYLAAIAAAVILGLQWPALAALEYWINPALALMLFATFLQLPLRGLDRRWLPARFLLALVLAQAVVIPLLVFALLLLVPPDPVLRFGVALVLLAPCIDYVVTFTRLGGGDARALLAATPLLLALQAVLLPLLLPLLPGGGLADLPLDGFFEAFVLLIALPLAAAALWQRKGPAGNLPALLPVPATALALLVVVAATVPRIGEAAAAAWAVLPAYGLFAVLAPAIGWFTGRLAGLDDSRCRALAFSTATRNSLVLLPIGLAVPGAGAILAAIIVTQTLVELICEPIYIRIIGRWQGGANRSG